ncbi:MAG TPA: lysophospholipid acyltransferase family protein [Bacteroidales bacterium]|nr:lysophospholipid acyltransferase family protein [Bacteroidales bacterium]
MNSPGYKILRSFARFWGNFPLRFLYVFSDILYYIAYYLLRYRRSVVRKNLLDSFPEKSKSEIKFIEKQFYHNLTDLFAEYLKMARISKEELDERMHYENAELLEELAVQGKSVFLATGHCGNWEWFGKAIPLNTSHNGIAIYKRLSNKTFEILIKEIRTNHNNLTMLESRSTYRGLKQLDDRHNAVFIAADQSPSGNEQDYWTNFLNRETAFFNGPEKMAKALDYAVIFVENSRIRRGYYKIKLIPVTLNPGQTASNEITEKYVRMLEKAIREQPDNLLWSHRRWKHQRKNIA